jgi:hypothetical protein
MYLSIFRSHVLRADLICSVIDRDSQPYSTITVKLAILLERKVNISVLFD